MCGPTFAYWDDLDETDNEDDLPDLPRRTISEGSTPWSNFKNLIIGQRSTEKKKKKNLSVLLNFSLFHCRLDTMTLSPLHKRHTNSTKKKSVTWRDRQKTVTKLLHETSSLIDVFYEVSAMLGPQINLNTIPSIDPTPNDIQPSKWQPILLKSCDDLHKTLSNFEPTFHPNEFQK